MAGIYARVLGLERVGVDDSFFDLGGDSLSAMRLVAAINTGLDAGLSVRAVFEAPTVAQLAPRIGGDAGRLAPLVAGRAARGGSVVVCPEPVVVHRPVAGALTGLQHGGGVAAARARLMPRRWVRRWPMWWAATRACARCSRRSRGYPSSWWCPPSGPTSVGTSLMPAAGRRAGWVRPWKRWRATAFDLATEIPLRARLFRVGDDEHVLVFAVHHIAADGWSITPLVRDLGVAYASRCAGQAPGWAPLAVQYVDYTLWQRAQLGDLGDSDSPIAAQLAYWEEALAGMPERLALPTDRPYPPVADYRGASVAVDWPAELQQQVARVAREHNATSFMVVQAALAVLLAKVSASSDVAVGFPIAGRA